MADEDAATPEDVHRALDAFKTALDAHLRAVEIRTGENDPLVVNQKQDAANAAAPAPAPAPVVAAAPAPGAPPAGGAQTPSQPSTMNERHSTSNLKT